ncbi:11885_t:CDS:2 [Funneliformis geosporum]|nr:11885_t:CDS:2 [Funneliformis geosporum]
MSNQPYKVPIGNFNEHYKILLDQLPLSMKKDVWLRLTNRKNKPLSEEQIRDIHPDIEELLTREYIIRLDGFEKQLEERELRVQQWENNIKKTIETQVAEERKHLKDKYDALMSRKESEYNNCMVDMKQKLYSFKYQLENQHNSNSADLEKQYKSQITTLEKSIVIKGKEIGKLSSTIFQLKNDKKDIKKSAERKCKELEDVIFAKDLKIIALNDKIISYNPHVERDATIESSSYFSYHDTKLWTGKREDAKNDLNIQKKYTFQMHV